MRVLMIGLGGIGQRHLRNIFKKFEGAVDVVAYRVRNRSLVLTDTLGVEEGLNLAERYPSLKVCYGLNEALRYRPDVALVCNPSAHHIGTALAAARAGCHLFIEKPLGSSLEGTDTLLDVARQKNLTIMVGFQLRFHPALKLMKEKLSAKAVGDIVAVAVEVGEYLPGWHAYEDYREMYASRAELGGGVVLSQIHELDYLYWLFGKPCRLVAMGGNLGDLGIDVEDTADILMLMSAGGRAFPISLHMDFLQKPPSRGCKIIGTKGKILLDLVRPQLVIEPLGQEAEIYTFPNFQRNQMFVDELDHFFDCVRSGRKPLVSLEDGIASLDMAMKVKQSLGSGEVVVA